MMDRNDRVQALRSVRLSRGYERARHRTSQGSNRNGDGTARHFRDVEIVDIASAGHWPHHDRLDGVMRFLGRTG